MTSDRTPKECSSCGVQLNDDGTVDALDGEKAEHYTDCAAPTADQIETGQTWHVVTRNVNAVVDGTFVGADGATYIRMYEVGDPDPQQSQFFNWPWQLRPVQCIGRRSGQGIGPVPTVQCPNTARPGTEYCEVCER